MLESRTPSPVGSFQGLASYNSNSPRNLPIQAPSPERVSSKRTVEQAQAEDLYNSLRTTKTWFECNALYESFDRNTRGILNKKIVDKICNEKFALGGSRL